MAVIMPDAWGVPGEAVQPPPQQTIAVQ